MPQQWVQIPNRKENVQLITEAVETLSSDQPLCNTVSLQAENKTSFMSCQTFQLLLPPQRPTADPAENQNPD